MRYAIVSDIHANLRAWNAVLEDIRKQGADVVVCLGDVVGYGPNPAEVLKAVRSVTNNFVMGNHDAAAVGIIDYSIFNAHARQAIEWTMTALDPEAKKFLSSVPLSIEADEILFVHAEISEPGRFDYIADSAIAAENFKASQHLVTFVGHTHFPKIFERSKNGDVTELPDNDIRLEKKKRYIINVGSVGEPRNSEDLRARYVIYDAETQDVNFRRVEFDIPAYRKDLNATSLTLTPFFLNVYEHIEEGREVVVTSGDTLVDMKVSHTSASLVDLGKVSGVANLNNSAALLKSAQPSRAPLAIIAIVTVLTLGILGFWILSAQKESTTPATIAEIKPKTLPKNKTEDTTKVRENNTPKVNNVEIAKPAPTPIKVAKIPDKTKPQPKPKPIPKPQPNPNTVPEIDPVPKVSNEQIKVAWWRMEDGKDDEALVDQKEQVSLIPIINGKSIKALAPDPVPENQVKNSGAKQLGVWQEEKSKNHFALNTDRSFTFEGWFFIGKIRKPVFLFGTRSNQEDGRGWHLDLRPRPQAHKGESISFFYDSGKDQIQAIAEDQDLSDGNAHHFAIIWDHNTKPDQGEMKVFLDGEKVASTYLPHHQINGEQFHPFQIGADFNPAAVGLDELRFTRKTLQPHEFLLRAPVQGITLLKADGRMTDSWSIPENWEDGKVPSGEQSVIIGPDLKVQIHKSKPPAFSGSLVLKEKAALYLWSPESESVLPKTEGKLIMFEDSRVILRGGSGTKIGPIELVGKAFIFGGISTSGHHTTRVFASKIMGLGELVLIGVNNNTFIFEAISTFSGGTRTKPQATQKFKVIAAADSCFGKGRVVIGGQASLKIRKGLENTIADDTSLILNGPRGTLATKLIIDSDETVGRFVIDNVDQGKGVFSKESHPDIISGNGKLTVE